MTYQPSRETKLGNERIMLTSISPESGDLLDKILDRCPADIREDETTERFLEWLYSSGLIKTAFTVEQLQQADKQLSDQMASMELKRPERPVYGYAYWLVRYSGMVEPNE